MTDGKSNKANLLRLRAKNNARSRSNPLQGESSMAASRPGRKEKRRMEVQSENESEEREEYMDEDELDPDLAAETLREDGYGEREAAEAREIILAGKREKEMKERHNSARALSDLRRMDFLGTRYPCKEALTAMGITRDVDLMLQNCGLSTFVQYPQRAYKEETLQFLATVQIVLYDAENESLQEKQGGGYIFFAIRGRDYRMTFKALRDLFEFPKAESENYGPDFDRAELDDVWRSIASTRSRFSSSRSKASLIRNPALRYFRTILANTFFSRFTTGTINLGEMEMLVTALKDIVGQKSDGSPIIGDRNNAGLTIQFANQLVTYRDWARDNKTGERDGKITIGGLITCILERCNVPIDETQWADPRFMNIDHLRRSQFLATMEVRGKLLYSFHHLLRPNAFLLLPNREYTTIRMGQNTDFNPPLEALYDPNEPQQSSSPTNSDEVDPEAYCFEEYTMPPRQGEPIREAHKHIGLLQKMNKWLMKKVKKLTASDEARRQENDDLSRRVAALERNSGPQPPPPTIRPRRASISTDRERQHQPAPARRSSANPAAFSYRRPFDAAGASSSQPLEHQSVEHSEHSTDTLEQAELERQRHNDYYMELMRNVASDYWNH